MKKKKLRLKFNSPVILTFAGICLMALLLNIVSKGATNILLFSTYRSSFQNPLTYVRMLTHVFGHADWNHLIGNMSYILLLGPLLEEKYGKGPIAAVIAIVALTTSLLHCFLFPYTALLGASGVCFALILLSSFTSFKEGEIPITFILIVLIYLVQQIYDGLFLKDNISNLAHILGGCIGAAAGFLLGKNRNSKSDHEIKPDREAEILPEPKLPDKKATDKKAQDKKVTDSEDILDEYKKKLKISDNFEEKPSAAAPVKEQNAVPAPQVVQSTSTPSVEDEFTFPEIIPYQKADLGDEVSSEKEDDPIDSVMNKYL